MLAAVFDYDTTAISLLIVPRPIAFSIGAAVAGRLVTRHGGRKVVVAGTVLQVAARRSERPAPTP